MTKIEEEYKSGNVTNLIDSQNNSSNKSASPKIEGNIFIISNFK